MRPLGSRDVPDVSLPLVSIGVPVYNAGALLGRTLESLLGQSMADFELIISDNASDDDTAAVCQDFLRRDHRIRYFRQPRNLGAPANWNFVARHAQGTFFKWAGARDLCDRDFLAKCLRVLQADHRAVLCYGRTVFIDEHDQIIGEPVPDLQVLEERPSDRFRHVCRNLRLNNAQCGLIRMEALRRTRLDRSYPNGDSVLMAELALQGKFILLDDTLFLRRLHRRADGSFQTGSRSSEELLQMFWPGAMRASPFLNVRRHADFFFSALASPIPLGERIRAAGISLQGLYWDRRGIRSDIARVFARSDVRRPAD